MADNRRKEAWRLHVQEGMPIQAIAQTLGVPEGTVKTWLHRERKARETAGGPNDGAAESNGPAREIVGEAVEPAIPGPLPGFRPVTQGTPYTCPACERSFSTSERYLLYMRYSGGVLILRQVCIDCGQTGRHGSKAQPDVAVFVKMTMRYCAGCGQYVKTARCADGQYRCLRCLERWLSDWED
jgi:transposase-like protein